MLSMKKFMIKYAISSHSIQLVSENTRKKFEILLNNSRKNIFIMNTTQNLKNEL